MEDEVLRGVNERSGPLDSVLLELGEVGGGEDFGGCVWDVWGGEEYECA